MDDDGASKNAFEYYFFCIGLDYNLCSIPSSERSSGIPSVAIERFCESYSDVSDGAD